MGGQGNEPARNTDEWTDCEVLNSMVLLLPEGRRSDNRKLHAGAPNWSGPICAYQ